MRNVGTLTARKQSGIVEFQANAAMSGMDQSASTAISRSADTGWTSWRAGGWGRPACSEFFVGVLGKDVKNGLDGPG